MNHDLFSDGALVLVRDWKIILALLTCAGWGTLLTFAVLKRTAKQDLTDIEITALAAGGWPLPALCVSALIVFLPTLLPSQFVFILAAALIAASTILAARAVWKEIALAQLFPIFAFLILFFLRLGFAAKAVLPPYFDSAEHYRIIHILSGMAADGKFTQPTSAYYHLGYHVIVAALTATTHFNPAQVMLLFGQMTLAAIPLPMYFLVRRATGSDMSAAFGVILVAFGWYMPGHALNWGKYPALLSLLLIQFTLGVTVLKNRSLIPLGIIASFLIHTRSIILLSVMLAAWALSSQLPKKNRKLFALTAILLGMSALLAPQARTLYPISGPYRIWITLLVGLLSVLSFQSFPRLTVFSGLAMLFLLAGIFVPLTASFTLLDRPLVEMFLALPLAFLGALGTSRMPKLLVTLLAMIIIIHAWTAYSFYPSDCCQLAGSNDMAALDWLDGHLPADAKFAIAGADLSLNTFSTPMQDAGVDAGIWIYPLTQRAVLSLPHDIDFTSSGTHSLLCENHVSHIYAGAMPNSFITAQVPEWYVTVFALSDIQIIQVIGCGQ